jgi:hypothetical protein
MKVIISKTRIFLNLDKFKEKIDKEQERSTRGEKSARKRGAANRLWAEK